MGENKESKPTKSVAAQRVARVYAEALLGACDKSGRVETVFDELDSLVNDVLPANLVIANLFSSAALGRRARGEIIDKAFAGPASELFHDFLRVLNDHERLDLLPAIHAAFRDLLDERARRVRIYVESAVPLQDDQKNRLREELRARYTFEPLLEAHVNPELLGGLRIRIGDMLFDSSIRTQLAIIRNQIIARSSHEIQSRRDRFCIADGN
jgi:F-type H+-transporting ATPase subunit delta